jgi:hypothetical protein
MSVNLDQVADHLGAESLNEDQKSDLRDTFASWLRSTCKKELEASGGQESSKTLTRYEDRRSRAAHRVRQALYRQLGRTGPTQGDGASAAHGLVPKLGRTHASHVGAAAREVQLA